MLAYRAMRGAEVRAEPPEADAPLTIPGSTATDIDMMPATPAGRPLTRLALPAPDATRRRCQPLKAVTNAFSASSAGCCRYSCQLQPKRQ